MRFEIQRHLLTTMLALASAIASPAEPAHSHPAPEKLGTVHFGSSCVPTVRGTFDRAVALLHSFAYDPAAKAFTDVAAQDPACAMAHWGVAMSVYHQLWSPPGPAELQLGQAQLPHALHMPSHIFTRLGFWDDSIESNEAARRVAHEQGDVGEELHAMDYLTYAYLQLGRDAAARHIAAYLRGMGPLPVKDLKVAYAATVIPMRVALERGQWSDMAAAEPLPDYAPQVAAITYWARSLAHARSGHPDLAEADIAKIDMCEAQTRGHGDAIWADQTNVLSREARAWIADAAGHSDEAVALLRAAADAEDGVEKPNVTPGPVLPAREQLGQLLLARHRPKEALRELTQALADYPGRRGSVEAAIRAADAAGDAQAAAAFRRQLGG